MFSPDGWAETYRLCARTTFSRVLSTVTTVRGQSRRAHGAVALAVGILLVSALLVGGFVLYLAQSRTAFLLALGAAGKALIPFAVIAMVVAISGGVVGLLTAVAGFLIIL